MLFVLVVKEVRQEREAAVCVKKVALKQLKEALSRFSPFSQNKGVKGLTGAKLRLAPKARCNAVE